MTKEELIAKLKEIANGHSHSQRHEAADDALIEFIDDTDISEAYARIPKWFD